MTFSVAGLSHVKAFLGSDVIFSDIYIRAAAKRRNNVSSTNLSNLMLSVGGAPAQALQYGSGQTVMTANSFAGGGSSAAILGFTNVISEQTNFVITGFSSFTWTPGANEPQRSNLAYQVKVGDFVSLVPVPEPSTYGFAGVGMIFAISMVRRRIVHVRS